MTTQANSVSPSSQRAEAASSIHSGSPGMTALITRFRHDAECLRSWSALPQAEVLERCANLLSEQLRDGAGETLSVKEAALAADVSEETVRRAVRSGQIVDLRDNPNGTIWVLASSVPFLRGKRRATAEKCPAPQYDLAAHAESISRHLL